MISKQAVTSLPCNITQSEGIVLKALNYIANTSPSDSFPVTPSDINIVIGNRRPLLKESLALETIAEILWYLHKVGLINTENEARQGLKLEGSVTVTPSKKYIEFTL